MEEYPKVFLHVGLFLRERVAAMKPESDALARRLREVRLEIYGENGASHG